MAYELHLEREGGIPLPEWKQAVAAVPGVRLESGDITANNPTTGERITIRGNDGDAAVLIDDEWVRVFRFRKGSVSFSAGPVDLEDLDDPISRVAFGLARLL